MFDEYFLSHNFPGLHFFAYTFFGLHFFSLTILIVWWGPCRFQALGCSTASPLHVRRGPLALGRCRGALKVCRRAFDEYFFVLQFFRLTFFRLHICWLTFSSLTQFLAYNFHAYIFFRLHILRLLFSRYRVVPCKGTALRRYREFKSL